jgi:hypothetical protein
VLRKYFVIFQEKVLLSCKAVINITHDSGLAMTRKHELDPPVAVFPFACRPSPMDGIPSVP